MIATTTIDQHPPVIYRPLADNFFAKVLQSHTLVMYEPHPESLADGIRRQIALKITEFETGHFYPFEDPVTNYRRELINLTTMLCDADMAAHGYPLVFTDLSFLKDTKGFDKYDWPLFYLLDANEGNHFAVSGAYTPEPRHIYPYTLPKSLTSYYLETSHAVYRCFSSNHVLVTGNSKLAPNWAKKHMERADNSGLFTQMVIIGEAGEYQVITQREFQKLDQRFKPTDPIVVGKRKFYKSFGPYLGDVNLERFYVITAYDPSRAEFETLKGFTQFT